MMGMQIIPPVRVKVSCVRSPEEARRAVSFGAAAIGMAASLPFASSGLAEDEIAAIASAVDEDIGTFLLTDLADPVAIAGLAIRCGVNTVQLWDELPPAAYVEMRRNAPDVSIAQTIHVVDRGAIQKAHELAGVVDALVLGSTNPDPPFRWDSPHGRTHDWEISRRIAESAMIPVILSGGLTSRNVADAVRAVRPYGVEVCSGVRRGDALDTSMLVQFLETLGRVKPL